MWELLPIVGGGFGWRALARELSGFIPVGGILIKSAIAYAGTVVVGEGATFFEQHGRHMTNVDAAKIYDDARAVGAKLRARDAQPHSAATARLAARAPDVLDQADVVEDSGTRRAVWAARARRCARRSRRAALRSRRRAARQNCAIGARSVGVEPVVGSAASSHCRRASSSVGIAAARRARRSFPPRNRRGRLFSGETQRD